MISSDWSIRGNWPRELSTLLYTNVYFRPKWYYNVPKGTTKGYVKGYQIYHDCTKEEDYVYPIAESGTCTQCDTYILPYKKLQVMSALKYLLS